MSNEAGWPLYREGTTMRGAFGPLRKALLGTRVLGAGVAVWLFAILLSASAVVSIIRQHGGLGSVIGVVAMILPLAFARRAPFATASVIAVATLLNALFLGHFVRCGAALPAAFYVGYAAGYCTVRRVRWGGLALVLAGIEVQCLADPRLGAGVILLMGPTTLLFFGAGAVVRSRSDLVTQLRERNEQLRNQRERTAQLAVAADQARIHGELIDGLRAQIHAIAGDVEAARSGLAVTGASLAAIEQTGRAALDRMRDIVGAIHSAPTEPEPDLDALADLVRSTTACDVRLTIAGNPRALPASVELSGYRIVERLLSTLDDDPNATAHVRLMFELEALELSVTGPLAADFDAATGFAGIVDRAALHGGTLRVLEPAGRLDAYVRLPLISSYA